MGNGPFPAGRQRLNSCALDWRRQATADRVAVGFAASNSAAPFPQYGFPLHHTISQTMTHVDGIGRLPPSANPCGDAVDPGTGNRCKACRIVRRSFAGKSGNGGIGIDRSAARRQLGLGRKQTGRAGIGSGVALGKRWQFPPPACPLAGRQRPPASLPPSEQRDARSSPEVLRPPQPKPSSLAAAEIRWDRRRPNNAPCQGKGTCAP